MPKVSVKKTKSALRKLKYIVAVVALLLAFATVAGFLYFNNRLEPGQIRFGNRKITLEEVATDESRQRGLGGRDSISDQAGMLFVYDKSDKYCFWMKDMRFAIDMLWLDENKKVVHIAAYVPPESFPHAFCPPEPARFVLEVRAGLARESGVKVGSQL